MDIVTTTSPSSTVKKRYRMAINPSSDIEMRGHDAIDEEHHIESSTDNPIDTLLPRRDSQDEDDDSVIEDEGEQGKVVNHRDKKAEWIVNAAISTIFILLWYLFSVSISVYNKWMFSKDKLNFPYPVSTTAGHQIVQSILAFCVTKYINRNTPRPQTNEPFDWKQYFKTFLPCAAASAGDIGMGNASMRQVTLTFYTMVKSSNLGFVLLFGFLFKLERPSLRLISIIAIMTIGVVMMVAGETEFQLLGFVLVISAAACSGLRWSLTQILMKRQPKDSSLSTHNNPLKTILYLSPLMGILLFVIGMILEGPLNIAKADLWKDKGLFGGIIILVFPGILAFCMTLAEFLLLNRTSVLTLSIAGIFKELVTLLVAALAFGDRLTLINSIGLVITLIAIIAYNWYRYTSV